MTVVREVMPIRIWYRAVGRATPDRRPLRGTVPPRSGRDPDRPAPTIQAQPGPYVGPFHWENRRIRVGEVKRLFGSPDRFDLVGSRGTVQAHLGNSVPPPLARVAEALAPG